MGKYLRESEADKRLSASERGAKMGDTVSREIRKSVYAGDIEKLRDSREWDDDARAHGDTYFWNREGAQRDAEASVKKLRGAGITPDAQRDQAARSERGDYDDKELRGEFERGTVPKSQRREVAGYLKSKNMYRPPYARKTTLRESAEVDQGKEIGEGLKQFTREGKYDLAGRFAGLRRKRGETPDKRKP